MARRLEAELEGDYLLIWEDAYRKDHTGLGILFRKKLLSTVSTVATQRPMLAARPRSIIVECELTGNPQPIWVVVNHWKSRMGSPASTNADRLETADWLGQKLKNVNRDYPVIVIGDFNAEPYESPFGELRLKGKRTFSITHRSYASSNLYNTSWRFLSEKDSWEIAGQSGYIPLHPTTSYGNSGNNIIDQLLVSRRILKGGTLLLQEESVKYYYDEKISRRNRYEVLFPRKWNYVSAGEYEGASDHFPLLATFKINNH